MTSDLDRLAEAAQETRGYRPSRVPPVVRVHVPVPFHEGYSPLEWGFGIGLGLLLAWLLVLLTMWLLGVGVFAAAQATHHPPAGADDVWVHDSPDRHLP